MKINIGAALASLRGRQWHFCKICEKRFSGIKTAIFCSNRCRQKEKYKKQAKQKMTA